MTQSIPVLSIPDIDWYRDVVEGAPETIMIVNRDFITLYHNQMTSSHPPEYFIGKSIFDFFLPEYHQLVREKINRVFETGQMDTYELATTYPKDELEWYTTRLGPIIRDGRVVAVTLFIRNATGIKAAEQALSRIKDKLEQRVEERTRTLNEYAHRLEVSEKLNAALRQAENRQVVFKILASHSKKVLGADLAGIYEIEDDRLQFSLSLGHSELPPVQLVPEDNCLIFSPGQANQIRFISLNRAAQIGCKFCDYVRSQQMHSLLVAPLRTGDILVGVLYLGFCSPRASSAKDEQLLNAFVQSGSNTLHRIQVMEQLENNIRQREHELQVLYGIMSIASEALDAEKMLSKSLRATLDAVDCSMGVIHLADPASSRLKIAVDENYPQTLDTFLLLSGLANDLWEKVYREGQPVAVRRLQTQSYHETAGQNVTLLTYLGVPVRAKEVTLGVLSILGDDESLLDPGVRQLVCTIADQIGLALETSRKRQRDQEALILEERQRLARELHDSVSQSLYGLVLSADVGNKLLKLKAYKKLAGTLKDIGDEALQSLKEMRLMLFELRPLSLEAVGLAGALELRLSTVEQRAGMSTSLETSGIEHLPKNLELEIYRIASEALNNSLKHSRASTVRVSLSASPEMAELVIEDNGKGFNTSQRRAGGIGLSSMQERSHQINGHLTIDSNPDAGTRVHLVVPLPQEEEDAEEEAA